MIVSPCCLGYRPITYVRLPVNAYSGCLEGSASLRFCCEVGAGLGGICERTGSRLRRSPGTVPMNSAWALMSLPPVFRTSPFLIIALASWPASARQASQKPPKPGPGRVDRFELAALRRRAGRTSVRALASGAWNTTSASCRPASSGTRERWSWLEQQRLRPRRRLHEPPSDHRDSRVRRGDRGHPVAVSPGFQGASCRMKTGSGVSCRFGPRRAAQRQAPLGSAYVNRFRLRGRTKRVFPQGEVSGRPSRHRHGGGRRMTGAGPGNLLRPRCFLSLSLVSSGCDRAVLGCNRRRNSCRPNYETVHPSRRFGTSPGWLHADHE